MLGLLLILCMGITNGLTTKNLITSTNKINEDQNYDLIIISHTDFIEELQPLKNHKENFEISTNIVTLEDIYNGTYFKVNGRDNAEKIKYFIKNAKEYWNTRYVFLVGGKEVIPVRLARIYLVTGNYSYYISDLYYADIYFSNGSFCSWDSSGDGIFADKNESGYVDEVDLLPDVCIGRALCKNESEVSNVVEKIITYETNSYNQPWFKNLVVCGGDDARRTLLEGILPFLLNNVGRVVFEGEYLGNYAAEILTTFNAKKIYASGFFRPMIKSLTIDNINEAINGGAGFLMFNGHGNINSAIITNFPFCRNIWLPEPSGYKSSDVQNLKNGFKIPVAIFGGCFCGDFNTTPNPIAWEFIKHENGGSIASFACTSGAQLILSSLITESLHGYLEMDIFKSYSDGTEIIGEIWANSIKNYLNDDNAIKLGDDFSILNWNHALSNHFIIEEWTLFGDPSLKIGGYE